MINKLKKKIYLSPPTLNGKEIKYLEKAINSNWIAPLGPYVDKFEKKICNYVGIKSSVALSSGTAALHLAMHILGVKKNDFVFCSDLTFVASANAIKYLQAKPVFIDSDFSSWNMCPKSLKKAFLKYKPKAVVVTDIYGQSADYKSISSICKENNTPIIEDAAESLGAEYSGKKCGYFGDMSALSFNGNKIITTSGGGMLLSNKKAYIAKAKKLSSQAREKKIYYDHKEIGYNYRLSNILAALGVAQFRTLDKSVAKKRKIFQNYKKLMKNVKSAEFMPEIQNGRSTNWLSVLLIKNKRFSDILNIIDFLNKKNIECRPIWKPMHLQPLYKKETFISNQSKPVSEYLFEHGLCLPSGLSLSKNNQELVIKYLKRKL